MIRINLLPGPKGRTAKPQYDVRAQALLGVGVLLITLASCWWYASSLDSEIEARQEEKRDKEKQVAQLKEQVKQFRILNRKRNFSKIRIASLTSWKSPGWDLSRSSTMSAKVWNHLRCG